MRDLAAATGEGIPMAIGKAAEERLRRIRRDKAGRSLADDLLEASMVVEARKGETGARELDWLI